MGEADRIRVPQEKRNKRKADLNRKQDTAEKNTREQKELRKKFFKFQGEEKQKNRKKEKNE